MKWVLGIASVVGVVTVMTTWGGGPPAADVVFITGSGHNHLDPQRMSWSHDIRIANCLYEPLVRLNFETMTTEPGAAESWDISEDGLTYTFHLRKNARWSNGDPVTAHDFVYAWRRALLPDMAADYAAMLWVIDGAKDYFDQRSQDLKSFAGLRDKFGTQGKTETARALYENAKAYFPEMVGVATPDDHTLVVTLERPTAYFLDLTAFATFMPVHAASVEEQIEIASGTGMVHVQPAYWSSPVTNGPYVIRDRQPLRHLHLTKSPTYWNAEAVRNDSVLELIITDPNTAMQAYETGQANLHLAVPGAGEIAKGLTQSADTRDDLHRQAMAGTYFYNFNCSPTLNDGSANPFHDTRVRRAFSLAIDRRSLIDNVTKGGQPIALSYIPVGALADYDPPVEFGVTFDPDAARALLAEAGYPDGKGLTGLSIVYNTGSVHDQPAQAIKRMWKDHLGVDVELEGVPVSAFKDRLKQQDYTIARAAWFGDYPDPTTWLQKMTTGDGNNDCKWSNAEFDTLVAKADTMERGPQRLAVLREAEALLLREQPMALLYQYANIYLANPDELENVRFNAWNRVRLEDIAPRRAD